MSDNSTEDGSEDSYSSHAFMKKYLKDNFGDAKYIYYKSPYAILAPRVFLRFLCAKTETDVRQNELLLLILCASPKLSDFQVWWCGWLHGSLESKEIERPKGQYAKVEIKRHMQWSLFLNESYIFSFKKRQNVIDRPLHEPYLVKKLTACFGEQDDRYKSLIDNIINSTGQKHGTMLVILEETEARSEAKRLGDSQYGLPEPFPREHAGEINRLNAIDGSVILDTYGKIYGIGMILDGGHPIQNELNSSEENGKGGDEIPKGNLARGARYNSGKKYYDFLRASGKKGMILIVSEDGSTDILATND